MSVKTEQASNVISQILAGTVANIANGFLVDARSRGLSPNTIRGYDSEIRSLMTWLEIQGVVTMDEFSADVIRKYLLSLQERRNPGGQMAAYRVIRQLTYFWESETDDQYKSPIRKVKPPKVVANPLPGVTQETIKKLLSACKGRNEQRNKTIILFLADTGLRAQELIDLDVEDVNLTGGSCVVRHGKGDKKRTVFIGQKVRRELRKYLTVRGQAKKGEPLFVTDQNSRLTYSGLRQIMRHLGLRAGTGEPGLHNFRRFYCVSMLRAGVDLITLSRLMGHAGIGVLSRYLSQVDEDLRQAHAIGSPVDHGKC